MLDPTPTQRPSASGASADPLTLVREALERLRFGAIALTVHEGRLVQVEVTEKHRFS